MSKEFYARLAEIQEHLNAPKNQYNSFGKYKYRSCEDILEGVKPLLKGLFLSITDEIVLIGDRYYVKATATITDGENSHSASAMAREEESKKGMDAAQVPNKKNGLTTAPLFLPNLERKPITIVMCWLKAESLKSLARISRSMFIRDKTDSP